MLPLSSFDNSKLDRPTGAGLQSVYFRGAHRAEEMLLEWRQANASLTFKKGEKRMKPTKGKVENSMNHR